MVKLILLIFKNSSVSLLSNLPIKMKRSEWIFCCKWWYAKIKILKTIQKKNLSRIVFFSQKQIWKLHCVCVHSKTILSKFRIPDPQNSRVIYQWSLYFFKKVAYFLRYSIVFFLCIWLNVFSIKNEYLNVGLSMTKKYYNVKL